MSQGIQAFCTTYDTEVFLLCLFKSSSSIKDFCSEKSVEDTSWCNKRP